MRVAPFPVSDLSFPKEDTSCAPLSRSVALLCGLTPCCAGSALLRCTASRPRTRQGPGRARSDRARAPATPLNRQFRQASRRCHGPPTPPLTSCLLTCGCRHSARARCCRLTRLGRRTRSALACCCRRQPLARKRRHRQSLLQRRRNAHAAARLHCLLLCQRLLLAEAPRWCYCTCLAARAAGGGHTMARSRCPQARCSAAAST